MKNSAIRKKICGKCRKLKAPLAFYPSKLLKSRLSCYCRDCELNRSKSRANYKKLYDSKYYKTIKGHLNSIYNAMIRRCNPQNKEKQIYYYGVKVLIPKEKFFAWSINQSDYVQIYKNWKNNKYNRRLSPSIDRIDSDLHYSLDNIRWLTLSNHATITNNKRWGNLDATA